MILRGVLLAAGLAALLAGILIGQPERFAITLPAAFVALVAGAGAIAADAVPPRAVPLACSIATVAAAIALAAGRGSLQVVLAALIVALQLVALASRVRARRAGGQRAASSSPTASPR